MVRLLSNQITYNIQTEDSSLLGCFTVLGCVTLKMMAHKIIKKVGVYLPNDTAQYPKDLNLQQHCGANLKSNIQADSQSS